MADTVNSFFSLADLKKSSTQSSLFLWQGELKVDNENNRGYGGR
jgi:hypothetical protein